MAQRTQTLSVGQFFGRKITKVHGREFGFYEFEYEPYSSVPLHAHEDALVSLLISGEYAEKRENHEFHPRCVVYHRPGEEHSERFGSECTRLFGFHVPPEVLDLLTDSGVKTRETHASFGLHGLRSLQRIRCSLASGSQIGLLAAEALAMELLCEIPQRATVRSESRRPRWMTTVCETLDADQAFRLRLSAIAIQIGISPSHLAREFKRWQGCTIGEYVAHRRLWRAMERIENSDDALTTIAADCGFADQSHLTRTIRRHTGAPPRSLRMRVKHQARSK